MSIRIIHPYGRSTVVEGDGEDGPRRRKLQRQEQPEDIEAFATSEPELLVAQWMAVLDKVLRKPNPKKGECFPEPLWQLRQALGSACWDRLKERLPKDKREDCEAIWNWRLDSEDKKKREEQEVLKILKQGKLFEGFLGKERLREWIQGEEKQRQGIIEELAERIEQHLHQAAFSTKGEPRKKNRGLIEHRAASIAANVPRAALPPEPSWLAHEEEIITALRDNDFAARIHDANTRMEREKKRRLYPAEAGEIISKACERQFGKKSRKEAGSENPALLAFLDDARAYYKRLFRSTRKRTLRHVLPRDIDALAHRLTQQHDNRRANALIRIGRVMHYEAMQAGGEEGRYDSVLKDGVESSRYWTSDGQHEIKRAEAFVRVWRNVISQAGLVLKAWVDPKGTAPGDIVGMKGKFEAALKARPSSPSIEEHPHLLFGQRAEEMLKRLSAGEMLETLAGMLRALRHGSLHFSSRQQFIDKVRENAKVKENARVQEKTRKAFRYLLQQDFQERAARLMDVCEGALLHEHAEDDEQLKKFLALLWECSTGQDGQDIVLPRFRRVMQRLQEVGLLALEGAGRLPGAPSAVQMEQDPWLRARYIGLKLAYEKPFRAWLARLLPQTLRTFIEKAANRATKAARKLNKPENGPEEVIISKAQHLLDKLPGDAGLATFIASLTAESASEYRIHDGYRSNPEKARALAGWVDKLHCEVMGYAFRAFCEEQEQVHWLLREEARRKKDASFPREEAWSSALPQEQRQWKDWHAGFYALLHLVPVQEAARLLHQLRKWRILEGRPPASASASASAGDADGQEADVAAMLELLELYLDMHDAKFTSSDMEKKLLHPFHDFYEGGGKDFEKVFFGGDEHEERLLGMRRDLREILRFGHLPLIRQIMGGGEISHEDVEALQEQEKEIAEKQQRRMELHEQWVKKKRLDDKQKEEYGTLVNEIQRYRQLRARVCLQNAARAQRLLVRIAARLADYAGLWERDLYFITLALAWQQGVHSLRELVEEEKPRQAFRWRQKVKTWALKQEVRDALHKTFTTEHEKTRNALAHFDILRDRPLCITRHANNARAMLAYDRKLKNAVSKSIINLLHEEGLTLRWNTRGHELHAVRVNSRYITHLGEKKIKEYLHDEDHARMVASMFGRVQDDNRPPGGGNRSTARQGKPGKPGKPKKGRRPGKRHEARKK